MSIWYTPIYKSFKRKGATIPAVVPIDPITEPSSGGRLADLAYDALRAAIQEGRLGPGQRIPEQELCALLRVSRTPVRDALRRLQTEGMVVHAPGGGLAVARLDVPALSELYDLRESLEGTAAALAARNADGAEINVLRAILASQRKLPADPAVHARENKKFHQNIYRAARNRFLLKCLGELHDAVALLGTTTLVAKGRPRQAWEEHEAIVSAIADRDPAAAEAAARRHVRRAFAIREAQLSHLARFGAPDPVVAGVDPVSPIGRYSLVKR